MAACNLTISFAGGGNDFIQNIQSKVINQGGTITGDESGGSLRVPLLGSFISGSYAIVGQQMNIVIDHKPFLISCKQIESYLKGNL